MTAMLLLCKPSSAELYDQSVPRCPATGAIILTSKRNAMVFCGSLKRYKVGKRCRVLRNDQLVATIEVVKGSKDEIVGTILTGEVRKGDVVEREI